MSRASAPAASLVYKPGLILLVSSALGLVHVPLSVTNRTTRWPLSCSNQWVAKSGNCCALLL